MNTAERPVVVLVPGLGNTAALWSAQRAALEASCEVIIPDYSGKETIISMADAVIGQVDAPRFSLAGFSLGGYIALNLVDRHPARLTRLALISSSPYADDEGARKQRRRLIEKSGTDYQGLLEDMGRFIVYARGPRAQATRRCLVDMGNELGAEEFCRQQRAAMARADCRDRLAHIRCPTRVLCGAQDVVTPPAGNRYLADHIDGATLTVIEGAGHLLPLEDPDGVTQFLNDWLRI